MAKISTYPLDGTPNLGDKLIGTDIDNLNATKNYTIGQILSVPGSSAYVPYTGATGNVNLGSNNLTVNDITAGDVTGTSFVKIGGLSTQFLKADGSVDSNTYLTTTAAAATYVPYTGATGNVDLGNNDLEADNVTANIALYTNEWHQIGSASLSTYDSIGNQIGVLFNYSQQKVRLGDFNGISTGTELIVDYNNQWVEIVNGALRVNGSVGTAGQVLKSQGAGLAPQWGAEVIPTIDQVLAAGNTATDKELIINSTGAVTGTIKLDGITGPGTTPNIFLSSDNGLVQNETEIRPAVILLENVTTQKRAEHNQEAIVFYDLNSGLYTTLQALTANLSANDVFLPSGGGTLALSVNGVAAGSNGDITLPIGAAYKTCVLNIGWNGAAFSIDNTYEDTIGITGINTLSTGQRLQLTSAGQFTVGKTVVYPLIVTTQAYRVGTLDWTFSPTVNDITLRMTDATGGLSAIPFSKGAGIQWILEVRVYP